MTSSSDQTAAFGTGVIPAERIESRIFFIRGEKVLLDATRELMSPEKPSRTRQFGFHTGIPSLSPRREKTKKKEAAKFAV